LRATPSSSMPNPSRMASKGRSRSRCNAVDEILGLTDTHAHLSFVAEREPADVMVRIAQTYRRTGAIILDPGVEYDDFRGVWQHSVTCPSCASPRGYGRIQIRCSIYRDACRFSNRPYGMRDARQSANAAWTITGCMGAWISRLRSSAHRPSLRYAMASRLSCIHAKPMSIR